MIDVQKPKCKPEQCKKEFIALFSKVAAVHDKWQTFCDFVEMAAIAISNQYDMVYYEEREARYLKLAEGYSREELSMFVDMLGDIMLAFQYYEDTPHDVMGELFDELEMHNKWHGQFFTPMHIASMMGELQMLDIDARLAEQEYITVNKPCVGAGAMLLGFAGAMKRRKHDYTEKMRAVAVDIDLKCIHMAYIQLPLYGIPSVVIHGNTLTVEEWSHWFTPAMCQAIAAEERMKQEAIPVTV